MTATTLVSLLVVALTPWSGADDFLTRVGKALRTAKAPAKVDGFRAEVKVEFHDTGKSTEQKKIVTADAEIEFVLPRYLRTEVESDNRSYVRAFDGKHGWMSDGKRSWSLLQKEYRDDRLSLMRELMLAKLMTKYLYPDRELRKLMRPKGPVETKLRRWSPRDKKYVEIDTVKFSGISDKPSEYPLSATDPKRIKQIQVEVWFAKDSLYPLQIRLTPVLQTDPKRVYGIPEELRFSNHKQQDGIVVPGHMLQLVNGRIRIDADFEQLGLNPELDKRHFLMPPKKPLPDPVRRR